MKNTTFITLISILIISIVGFAIYAQIQRSTHTSKGTDDKFTILATTGMIADIAENVAGDNAHVDNFMGPGIDPHTYQPTASDITAMREADIIFHNGLHLEAQINDALEGMHDKATNVSQDIDRATLLPWDVEDDSVPQSEAYDPHIWNDVSLWIEATKKVSKTLQQRDPANSTIYQQNTEDYIARLTVLDSYVREQIATIPQEKRYLISTHDAFGYFARAYDIPARALLGISTEAEASTQEIQALADFIVANDIPAIFGENITSDKFSQSVLEAVEQRGHSVIIGGELYSDALGEEGTPQDTYEGMVRSNVDTIVAALTSQTQE